MSPQKKKRQTKSEHVLVRMEPDLKKKLVAEARRRALDPSALARMLVSDGLEHEEHNREMRKDRMRKQTKAARARREAKKKKS